MNYDILLDALHVDIFADGPTSDDLKEFTCNSRIKGYTTNPSLLHKIGVIPNYQSYARWFLEAVGADVPVSFEVVSDDPVEMEKQARKIATWGGNVFVKVPFMNTQGASLTPIIHRLSHEGVKVNVTAVFTETQAVDAGYALANGAPSYISVFAGRIADTGRNPMTMILRAREALTPFRGPRFLWASARELYNVVQAHDSGCAAITLSPTLIRKLPLLGKDLFEYSKETVRMFYNDAQAARLNLGS